MARRRLSGGPLLGLLLAGVLALAVGACGSSAHRTAATESTRVSATSYVTSLCEAVGPFEQDIAARSRSLDTAGTMTVARGKRVLVSFLSGLAADTAAATDRLERAGVPEVRDGANFATAVLGTFTRVTGALRRSETVAENLSTASPTQFHAEALKLGTAVRESVGEIGQGLSTQSSKALDAAASKVPACHQL